MTGLSRPLSSSLLSSNLYHTLQLSPFPRKLVSSFCQTDPLPDPKPPNSLNQSTSHFLHASPNVLPPSLRVPDEVYFRVLSVSRSGLLVEGATLHSPIIKLCLRHNTLLCNRLLNFYGKSHGVDCALKLFDELPRPDVVTWTTVISAFLKDGDHNEALRMFQLMRIFELAPNEFTFSMILQCCSSFMEFEFGTYVHAQVLKSGLALNPVVGTALMHLYSEFNMIQAAKEVFSSLGCRDDVSWTTMISSFVKANDWCHAWETYKEMVASGCSPSEFTFSNVLVACGSLGIYYGEPVHAHLIVRGVGLNLILKTALIDMYMRFYRTGEALKVLQQTPDLDVALCTILISGYNQISDYDKAILMFRRMCASGISPNAFTYAGILCTCSSIRAPEWGKQIHSKLIKVGLEDNISAGNALMDMYTKSLSDANQSKLVFDKIRSPNVVSWTALITSFSQCDRHEEAYLAFVEMRANCLEPNSFTLSATLRSCGSIGALDNVRRLHAYIAKTKFGLFDDKSVGNSLLDAYSRLGTIKEAREIFKNMSNRDVITYTSLVRGMNHLSLHDIALDMIPQMRTDNVNMDELIVPCFLASAAGMSVLESGKQLHCHAIKHGLIDWISVSNGLIDMYSKCGSPDEARSIFKEIAKPNVVSWNSLISGLASSGHFSEALSSFEDMRMARIVPDDITFLLVLYACSHAGLAKLGKEHFNSMWETYGVSPKLDHYVCLVDLLGRSGRLEEAAEVIYTMPFRPNALTYKTLLGSCKIYRNLVLGESMAWSALALDPLDPAVYILLSNMYDDAGKSEYAVETRRMMRDRGIVKCPGQSSVEIRNRLFSFRAGDTSNPRIGEIHRKLESLEDAIKRMAGGRNHYVGKAGSMHHSEKLALAFALLNAPPKIPIRIIKNLRTCDDCHAFMELSSRVVNRVIIMRDGNRFHFFKEGLCSCGGYW